MHPLIDAQAVNGEGIGDFGREIHRIETAPERKDLLAASGHKEKHFNLYIGVLMQNPSELLHRRGKLAGAIAEDRLGNRNRKKGIAEAAFGNRTRNGFRKAA